MRLPLIALATALQVSIVPASISAQTGTGILDIWLKVRESADAPNDKKITLYTKSKALVIGMDHYDTWPKLSTGIKDAEEVAKGLTAQGFEVTLMKDLKSADLDSTLKSFFISEGDDPNARLLLWFAGHGDTIDGEAYLVPTDAPLPKVDSEFRLKAVSLRRFSEYMREAKARHVLAIFDSCFSGGVFNVARSAPPPAITLATAQPVREFISSGEAEQQVSDDGTFRRLFLDALAGKEPDADANHDGYVTGSELGLFLQQKMTNLTNNRQTPRYGKLNAYGYDRGDFVFQVGKLDAPSIAAPPAAQSTTEAERAWAAAQNTTSQAVMEEYIKHYGDSFYGALARARLEEMKKSQVAVVSPPTAAPPVASGPCGGMVLASLSSRAAKPLSAAEECALKPKDVFKECDKCPEMVVVPPGSFTMGSPNNEKGRSDEEGPQHNVTISYAFAVGKFTVTVDQFAEFAKETSYEAGSKCRILEEFVIIERSGHSFRNPGFSQIGSHPVVCLNWKDAKTYVAWLSKKTGKPYRLPTEAEWEYAARAGTMTTYYWGDDLGKGNANCAECGSLWDLRQPAPVGSFQPNPFWLYDMLGNVEQWVEDCYHDNYAGAPINGSAWTSRDCSARLARGGGWYSNRIDTRVAVRHKDFNFADGRSSLFGFRVARTQ